MDLDRTGTRHEHLLQRTRPRQRRRGALLQRARGADPVDPEAPHVAGPVAVCIEVPVPVDGGDLDRLHRAGGQLVTRTGEIVDLHRPATVGRLPHHGEVLWCVDIESDHRPGPERGVELGQGAPQRSVLRARHGQEQARRCGDGEPLGRGQAARPGVLRRQEGPD